LGISRRTSSAPALPSSAPARRVRRIR
jgi:hypothetical protein